VSVPQHLAGLPEFQISITCSQCGVQPSVQACNDARCAGGACREAFCRACLNACEPRCDSFTGAPLYVAIRTTRLRTLIDVICKISFYCPFAHTDLHTRGPVRRTCLVGSTVTAFYFFLGGTHQEFVDEVKDLNKGLVPTASFHFASPSAIAQLRERTVKGELCTIEQTVDGRATELVLNFSGHSYENNSGSLVVGRVALPTENVLGVCELVFRPSTIPRPHVPTRTCIPHVTPRLALSHDRSFGVNCVR